MGYMRNATLCILRRENGKTNEVLLGMKKKGFGQGRWNGFGGKVEANETIEQATAREVLEEVGLAVDTLEKMAVLDFYFPHKQEWNQQVHVFFTKYWKGEPKESDEMKPQWFPVNAIPFDVMWPDDRYWLPRALNGERLKGTFSFAEGDKITSYKIDAVKELS